MADVTEAPPRLSSRLVAELLGTFFLVAAVVGSGIAAERLSPDDVGLQLFESAAATAGALIALILAFGAVSGAHFNPVVSLVDRFFGGLTNREFTGYVAVQMTGGAAGAVVANLMFSEPAVEFATTSRSGGGLWLAEVVATLGLVLVIFGAVRAGRTDGVAVAVGVYIGAAYFFTASTSFANPAVTVARVLTDTFSGITPASAAAFVGFQLVGAVVAIAAIRLLHPSIERVADAVVVPHGGGSVPSNGSAAIPSERTES